MDIPTLNLIFILANLRTCPHRTCGTVVSRILVRGSINYIKNNIKDTHNNNSNSNNNQISIRIALVLLLPLRQLSLEAAIIVVILKSIRPTSDLKIVVAIVSASLIITHIVHVFILIMMTMTMMMTMMLRM